MKDERLGYTQMMLKKINTRLGQIEMRAGDISLTIDKYNPKGPIEISVYIYNPIRKQHEMLSSRLRMSHLVIAGSDILASQIAIAYNQQIQNN